MTTRRLSLAAILLTLSSVPALAAGRTVTGLRGPSLARSALTQIRSFPNFPARVAQSAIKLDQALEKFDASVADRLTAEGINTIEQLDSRIEALAQAEFISRRKAGSAAHPPSESAKELEALRTLARAVRVAEPFVQALGKEGVTMDKIRPTAAGGALQDATHQLELAATELFGEFKKHAEDRVWISENLGRLQTFLANNAMYLDDDKNAAKAQLARLFTPLNRRSHFAQVASDTKESAPSDDESLRKYMDSQLADVAERVRQSEAAPTQTPHQQGPIAFAMLPDLSLGGFPDETGLRRIQTWLRDLQVRMNASNPNNPMIFVAVGGEAHAKALLSVDNPMLDLKAAINHKNALLIAMRDLGEAWNSPDASNSLAKEAAAIGKAVTWLTALNLDQFLTEHKASSRRQPQRISLEALPDLSNRTFSDETAVRKIQEWLQNTQKIMKLSDSYNPMLAIVATGDLHADALLTPPQTEESAAKHRQELLKALKLIRAAWVGRPKSSPSQLRAAEFIDKAAARLQSLNLAQYLKDLESAKVAVRFGEIKEIGPLNMPLDPEIQDIVRMSVLIPKNLEQQSPHQIKLAILDFLQWDYVQLKEDRSGGNSQLLKLISELREDLEEKKFDTFQIEVMRGKLNRLFAPVRVQIDELPIDLSAQLSHHAALDRLFTALDGLKGL